VLVLDMIEILPPLEKYKYDTWRILPVKCYIDNSVHLHRYIQNVNIHGGRRANHSGGMLVPSVAHSRTPTMPRMPSVARAPMVPLVAEVTLATVDLQAKLQHHRSGEDGRITIECQQKRHRNLDSDFGCNTHFLQQ
jgi:hypothetical protein